MLTSQFHSGKIIVPRNLSASTQVLGRDIMPGLVALVVLQPHYKVLKYLMMIDKKD